jgi:hypothetical protein
MTIVDQAYSFIRMEEKMKTVLTFTIKALGFTMLLALLVLIATAQADSLAPVRIGLVANEISYSPTEPIKIQVVVYNDQTDSIADVISRVGWFHQDFHLMITFIDPDGIPKTHKFPRLEWEPGPPYRFLGKDAVRVEIIPSDGKNIFVMDDARSYYDLSKYGSYTAMVYASLETFSEYVTQDTTGDLFSYLDDPGRQAFNPVVSNQIRFEIISPEPEIASAVDVYVNLINIDETGPNPGAQKSNLTGAEIHLIRQSKIPEEFLPANWKVYSEIWKVDPDLTAVTDNSGMARFYGIEKDDWVVLARHPEFSDIKHMGSLLGSDDLCWVSEEPCEKHLMVLVKPDAKKVAGKTKKLKGSLLLITEPEYVEWHTAQELYPFVFETIGDWSVSTSVNPPEGFETDYDSLSADVTNEIEAVQFTITDVGSEWKETKVKYKIKHGKKTESLESKIGIKLSKKLAKDKGLGIYGQTEDPGPFKGGKKVKYLDKDK